MVSVMFHRFPARDDNVIVRPFMTLVAECPAVGNTVNEFGVVMGKLSHQRGHRADSGSARCPRDLLEGPGATSPGDKPGWEEFGSSHPVRHGSIVHRK
jgi:hypothetical protein